MTVVIRLTGELAVYRGGNVREPGTPVPLGSRKARRLLALLAASRGRGVSAAAAVTELWGDRSPRRPEDNVAVLVSRLRSSLGADAVRGGRGGYRLATPPDALVDVDVAAREADEARRALGAGSCSRALALAVRGLDLLGEAEALAGEHDAEWVGALRGEVEDLRRTMRHLTAEAALAAGDPATAVTAARAAAGDDPLDDPAHRLLMTAYHASGEQARALKVFARLRGALIDELGVDPAPETQRRHLAILRGDPAEVLSPEGAPRDAVPRLTGGPVPTVHAGRAAVLRPERPNVTAPVGRRPEIARLTGAWAAARRGRPSLWVLSGEGGIGKTTLADAFADLTEVDGGLVLRARGHAAERSLLLQPLLDALGPHLAARSSTELRSLAGARAPTLAGLFPELSEALGAPPVTEEGGLARRQAFDALRALLVALACERPLLLVVDDLHDAGAASTEFLHFAARRLRAAPVLLLATARDTGGAGTLEALAEVGHRLTLGPLTPEAVSELARCAGLPERADDVARRTRGHPLFVAETLQALAEGGHGVPDSLQDAVATRLRHLGGEVADALRAAAVLGSVPAPDIVAAMLDVPSVEVLRRFDRATAARVLTVIGPAHEFANDVVREIVYDSTSTPLRAAHHRVAADLLADRPEALARHAAEIGDHGRAARAWLVAGQRALGRGATTDAAALLDAALVAVTEAQDPVLVGRVHLVRARTKDALADAAATEEGVSAAIASARCEVSSPGSWAGYGRAAREVGPGATAGPPQAVAGADEALRLAEARIDRSVDAELCGWRAVVSSNRLRFDDALAWGRQGLATARACGDEASLVAGLDGLKTALAYSGDLVALDPVLHELEPLARRRGDRQVLFWTTFESGLAMVARGDLDAAEDRIDEAYATCRSVGLLAHAAWFEAHLSLVERLRGDLDRAVERARRSVESTRRHPWWWTTAAAALGTALLERAARGDREEAVRVLTEGLVLAEEGGTEAYVLRCLAPLAEAREEPDLVRRAELMIASITAPPGACWLGGADTYLSVARARLALGDTAAAREVLQPLRTAARRHRWPCWEAAADLVEGRSGAPGSPQNREARRAATRAAPSVATGR